MRGSKGLNSVDGSTSLEVAPEPAGAGGVDAALEPKGFFVFAALAVALSVVAGGDGGEEPVSTLVALAGVLPESAGLVWLPAISSPGLWPEPALAAEEPEETCWPSLAGVAVSACDLPFST